MKDEVVYLFFVCGLYRRFIVDLKVCDIVCELLGSLCNVG